MPPACLKPAFRIVPLDRCGNHSRSKRSRSNVPPKYASTRRFFEIAFFIASDPEQRIGTKPSRLVVQSEDVLVDRRGYIYISHKNQGIYILRLKKILGPTAFKPSLAIQSVVELNPFVKIKADGA